MGLLTIRCRSLLHTLLEQLLVARATTQTVRRAALCIETLRPRHGSPFQQLRKRGVRSASDLATGWLWLIGTRLPRGLSRARQALWGCGDEVVRRLPDSEKWRPHS